MPYAQRNAMCSLVALLESCPFLPLQTTSRPGRFSSKLEQKDTMRTTLITPTTLANLEAQAAKMVAKGEMPVAEGKKSSKAPAWKEVRLARDL
jgi:hypothetical protein